MPSVARVPLQGSRSHPVDCVPARLIRKKHTLNSKFFRDTAVYAIAPQLPKLLNLLVLPFITPYLTPKDYGIFGLLVAYTGLVDGLKDLGLSVVITNVYFKQPRRYLVIWSRLYSFLSLWSLLLFVAMMPLVYLVVPETDRSLGRFVPLAIAVLLPSVVFSTPSSFAIAYLRFQQRPFPIALVSIASGLVTVFSTYILISVFHAGYKGFVYSSLIGASVGFVYFQFVVRSALQLRLGFNFSWRWIWRKLKKTLPTVPHYYSNYLLTFSDRLLLHWSGIPVSQIGLYSFAYNLGNNFSTIGKSVGKAATPVYMTAYKGGNQGEVARLTQLLQIGFVVLASLCCLWMREIFGLLAGGTEMASSYYLALPVVFANTVYPMYFATLSLLYYHEQTKVFWKITVVACIVNVGFNLVLIPIWGINAAAFVTLVSYLYMGFSGFFAPEFRTHNKAQFHEIAWLAVLIGTFLIAWFARDASPIVKGLLSAVACAAFGAEVIDFRRRCQPS
jgi:O-antigen/teichoic acid export membrane protein